MFRLEPKDIAQLVLQQRALLEAMYEGVFAVNEEKQLILINRAAREMLDIHQSEKALIGKPLEDVLQTSPVFYLSATPRLAAAATTRLRCLTSAR